MSKNTKNETWQMVKFLYAYPTQGCQWMEDGCLAYGEVLLPVVHLHQVQGRGKRLIVIILRSGTSPGVHSLRPYTLWRDPGSRGAKDGKGGQGVGLFRTGYI